MPWYKVKSNNDDIDYRYALSENNLLFDLIRNGHWQISIFEWKPKKLDYKALLIFYKEVQSALQSGLQLNQAITHLALSSTHPTIAIVSKALLGELERGALFNNTLSKLTNQSTSPYCQLLNSQGTREDCEKSLSVSIEQLNTLLNWSQRLLKAIAYPFSIIQIALTIMIANRVFQSTALTTKFFSLISDIGIYILCSSAQLLIIHSLYKGNACHWLEKFSDNFRLTKLFSLLSTTRKTGLTLQDALKSMPEYFKHAKIKEDILSIYYTLKLGQSYASSFPIKWFPNESAIALHSAEQDGDIERALTLAAKEHEKRWQKNVSLLEKIIPACCLFIAGGFVTSALISLYAPLLEMPT
ncbi:secretion system protein [Marinomonas ushuaiensis DSM 15871]|uniref:Secretion system protein n=1 Tax=Marinomonas ushuaiensis DSM 15871 TaxID=1122207 RepID=X7E906_9GAMM|nr:type II secretion system F family protein [Marinomonas ushuaiensis]ETX11638.1 secretion system protein [Marinomonas ushuaiensis DSM 15871]